MRLCIVGGGAAGMCAAHLLDPHHDVTVLEKASKLGGHIRTLGRNVPNLGEDHAGTHLDTGVIEFAYESFPTFHRLLRRLGVPIHSVPGTTTLLRRDGQRLLGPGCVTDDEIELADRLAGLAHLLPLARSWRNFLFHHRREEALVGRPLSAIVGDDDFGLWIRLLTTYAYSIPASEVGDVPAALAVPMLRAMLRRTHWTAIEGGTYRYIEEILTGLRGRTRTGVNIDGISRDDEGVTVEVIGEAPERFDAVILAAPPDQVLRLLRDPTTEERSRFAAWRANRVHTLLHNDEGPYARRGETYASEFDVFETPTGGGYNAFLNRLAQVPAASPHRYGLAFGIDEEIASENILRFEEHHTPLFSVEAFSTRDEILACNGQRHTWHVGAWLGDGLHEGAVTSAVNVAAALGGDSL